MRPIRFCLAFLSLALLSACEENPTEIWNLRADPSVCDNGVDYQFCGYYTVEGTSEAGTLYQGIDGLDQQWGYSYRIEVEIIEVENPGADGFGVRYELVELLEQEAHPGLEFDLRLTLGSLEVGAEGGAVATGNEFTCTPEQCMELGALIDEGHDIRGVFRFGAVEQMFPLELVSFEIDPNE